MKAGIIKEGKENKECSERRLFYGACKSYIKGTDYNTDRD